jgi:hypothetical protein
MPSCHPSTGAVSRPPRFVTVTDRTQQKVSQASLHPLQVGHCDEPDSVDHCDGPEMHGYITTLK